MPERMKMIVEKTQRAHFPLLAVPLQAGLASEL